MRGTLGIFWAPPLVCSTGGACGGNPSPRAGSAIIPGPGRAPGSHREEAVGGGCRMRCERRMVVRVGLAVALFVPSAASAQEPELPAGPVYELSLEDAVQRALENNADLVVERYNPQDAAEAVTEVKGVYDPLLFSTVNKRSQTTPATNIFAGAESVKTDSWVYDFGVAQYLPSGANLQVDFPNSKQDTNNRFVTVNPGYNSALNFTLNQPLLRDFLIDRNRQQITVAKRNREISDVQFRQTVINTVAGVKQLYYDMIFALDNLEAQRKSLALAKKLLDENQIKVRVGTMAPLDVVAAESEVAGREEGVITAEATVLDAEDALKRAIMPANDPKVWQVKVVPKDRPTAEPVSVDLDKAIDKALKNRTDVVATRKNLENLETTLKLAKNQALPRLDLQGFYGSSGIGGTQVLDENGQPLVPPIVGGYNDALSSVFGFDFPTWQIGAQFS